MLVLDWSSRNCGIDSLPGFIEYTKKEGEESHVKIHSHHSIFSPYAVLLLGHFFRGNTEQSRTICKDE